MLFSSYEFIFVFLPVAFFVYFWLNSAKMTVAGKAWLVLCSLFFYSWWNVDYLPLILVSMLVNYSIGTVLGKEPDGVVSSINIKNTKRVSRKAVLTTGIIFNLSLLGYFKYMGFLTNIVSDFGWNTPSPEIILPLAISFFTFQQIAYLVDSYRRETREYDFLNYALFVTFFPQLIAGPIVHHKEMMPQFSSRWNLMKRYRNIVLGVLIFSMGLFKKVVIADTFALWATPGFDVADELDFYNAWMTSLSYTFQLYFDFSGYTDMAIGIALLFNVKLPNNFNSPYVALSIQDFWRRWHITLSRFLRDYLYIPLGGNRCGEGKTLLNLFITFLLGGLWHGASWMFVIWGAMHGLALILHRLWTKFGITMPKLLAWFLTFNFINITWIFFRANDVEDATKVIDGMFSFNADEILVKANLFILDMKSLFTNSDLLFKYLPLFFILLGFVIVLFFKNSSWWLARRTFGLSEAIISAVIFSLAIVQMLGSAKTSEFLYFNF